MPEMSNLHANANIVKRLKAFKKLEDERSMVRKLAKGPATTRQILFSWYGTTLEWSFKSYRMWISLLIFVAVRITILVFCAADGEDWMDNVPAMDMKKVAVIGAFHGFFVVFFASQSFGRYMKQYSKSCGAIGRVIDTCLLAKTCFEQSEAGQAAAWRLMRHTNAIQVLGYVGLSDSYTNDNFFVPYNELHQIVSPAEMKRLNEMHEMVGGHSYREATAWALRDVEDEVAANRLDKYTASQMREKILLIRDSIRALYGMRGEPMPFFYVHLITAISGIYLPLLAYGVAIQVEFPESSQTSRSIALGIGFATSFLSVIAVCLATIGLQAVGQQLSDPYGDDVMDLSVMKFCTTTVISTRRICAAPVPEKLSIAQENNLSAKMMANLAPEGDEEEFMYKEPETGFLKHVQSSVFKAPSFNPGKKGRGRGVSNPLREANGTPVASTFSM